MHYRHGLQSVGLNVEIPVPTEEALHDAKLQVVSYTNDHVQVMMDGMEDSLLLHWATTSSQSAPETLSLRLSEYTTDAAGALASSRASDMQL